MYLMGRGVEKNEAKAFELNLKMAKAGHLRAMLNAGLQLRDGQGTPQNYEEAWDLLNQVRMTVREGPLHWKAVAALDQIKTDLGVDRSIGRLDYPEWQVVQRNIRQKH
jgi:hypothetical protein